MKLYALAVVATRTVEGQTVIDLQVKARNDQPVPAVKPRIAGLHAGAAWMSDDFDAPLPEDFLIK